MLDEQLITRALFGGAIEMSLPQRFVDVSDYRPVPDHQEVWTDATLDQSVILEIVEHQPVPDQDCCKLYFNDMAEHNQAASSQMQNIRCPSACLQLLLMRSAQLSSCHQYLSLAYHTPRFHMVVFLSDA